MKKFLPILLLGLALIYVLYEAKPPAAPKTGPDYHAFGQIPVVSGGRIKPLDTVARNALREINGKATLREKATDASAAVEMNHNEWLAEVLFDAPAAGKRRVLLVENDEVKALFNRQGEVKEKRFSISEVGPATDKIQEIVMAAEKKPKDYRTVLDKQVMALYERMTVLGRLMHSIQPPGLRDYKARMDALPSLVERVIPATARMQRGESYDEAAVREMSMVLQAFQSVQRLHGFYAIPPRDKLDALENWSDIGTVVLDEVARGAVHDALDNWARIADAWHRIGEDNGASFNAEVQRHREWLDQRNFAGLNKASSESWFNDFEPFYVSMVLYVAAFLVVLAAWLTGSRALFDSAFRILLLTLVVHSLGIIIRIWLSGRPPVTNLYSSAIFIGWGVLIFCLVLERAFLRNGIASACAALVGFGTMLIAHHLSFDGDTLEVKQAVLDSNFWLTTHVLIITLGYCAVFLAGFMAILWLILNLCRARFFDAKMRRVVQGAVYGVLCFALLFSFVGTVLGGIWGDQSWGRFWGWDPKENGALLIVLWNAIILHARWGGMIREKGLMVLAMGGNIVTAWSWFGTNMLGIGLHSYGFMEAAYIALVTFAIVQLILMILVVFVADKKPAEPPPLPKSFGTDDTASNPV
ncbi:MAG: cytochrome c biogenesis protein [Verrucomicrobiales bacterium]